MNAEISGTGSCLGDKEYSNFDLWGSDLRIGGFNIGDLVRESFDTNHWRKKLEEAWNGTNLSDAEVFDKAVKQMSGIERRCFSTTRSAEELGAEAATRALDAAGITASDLDYVFVGTFTPDKNIPQAAVSVSHLVSKLIGVPERRAAVTHNEACAGFIYGMDLAYAKLQTGDCENILVVSTEHLSGATNFGEYKTSFLFGDGAGAVVLKADENGGIICPPYVGAEYSESIWYPYGGLIQMKGGEDVLKNASRKMVESAHIALLYHALSEGKEIRLGGEAVANYKEIKDNFGSLKGEYPLDTLIGGVDWIIPHQANMRIIMKTAAGLIGDGDGLAKLAITINKYANTSGGSIPITFDDLIRDGTIKRGDTILMTAYGGGSTHGALVFTY